MSGYVPGVDGNGCCMCHVPARRMSRSQIEVEKYRKNVSVFSCTGSHFILSVTTLVLGILGAIGVMQGSTLGYCALGLGGGSLLISSANTLNCATTRQGGRFLFPIAMGVTSLIFGVILITPTITLGGLGAGGILSSQALGWSLIGTSIATGLIFGSCSSLLGCLLIPGTKSFLMDVRSSN